MPKSTRGLPLRVFLTQRIARCARLCLLRVVLICDDSVRATLSCTRRAVTVRAPSRLSVGRLKLAMDAYTGQGGSAGGQAGADDAFRLPALASLAAASSSAAMSPPSGSSSHIPLPSLRYRMLGQAGAAQQSFPSMDALAGTSYEQAASGGMGELMSPPPLGTDANGRKVNAGQKRKSSTTPGDAESEAGKAKKVRPFPPLLVALAKSADFGSVLAAKDASSVRCVPVAQGSVRVNPSLLGVLLILLISLPFLSCNPIPDSEPMVCVYCKKHSLDCTWVSSPPGMRSPCNLADLSTARSSCPSRRPGSRSSEKRRRRNERKSQRLRQAWRSQRQRLLRLWRSKPEAKTRSLCRRNRQQPVTSFRNSRSFLSTLSFLPPTRTSRQQDREKNRASSATPPSRISCIRLRRSRPSA